MNEWINVRLGEVANIEMGQSPESAYYNSNNEGIPLIQGNADIKERKSIKRIWTTHPTKICNEGDILMTVRAPVGSIGISSFKSCLGRGVCGIKASSINNMYLYHLLIDKEESWKQFEQGSTFTAVGSKEIYNFQLSISSSKSVQKKIAHILTTCDTVIEQTQSAIAKYKAIKQGLLHDLFTRGLTANGRLRPSYHDAPELYKESELGIIPKEWEDVKIGDVSFMVTNGFVGIATPYYTTYDKGVPYLYGTNIREDKIEFENLRYISREFHNNHVKSQLKSGDMLCVQSGHIGTCAIVPDDFTESNCHALIITRFNKEIIYPEFISFYLNSSIGKKHLDKIIVGSTIKHVNTSDLAKHLIIKPSLDEQKEIAQKLALIDKKLKNEETLLQKYRSIKRGLMCDLLGGRKEV